MWHIRYMSHVGNRHINAETCCHAHTHTHTQCTCRLTCTPEYTNNHISDLLATLHPRTCPYWADLLLTIISRKHGRPCRPALVPISYAHCIISTQQPGVTHQLLLMTMRGRERIFVPCRKEKDEIPHNSTRGYRKSQPVSGCVCLPLCWPRCPRVAICHNCPFYICVCLSIYWLTHTLTPHTHWEH